jgi:FtsZ-interacting cell division protein ZipA
MLVETPLSILADTGSFLIIPQADSPGNDYSRIDHFSYENCRNSCEADDGCNPFTYNHAQSVCFLKRAANQWTTFYAWAITGIKLSSLPVKGKITNTEQAQAPQPPATPIQPQVEQAQAPQPPAAPIQPQVATPSKQAEAPQSPHAVQPQVEQAQAPRPAVLRSVVEHFIKQTSAH